MKTMALARGGQYFGSIGERVEELQHAAGHHTGSRRSTSSIVIAFGRGTREGINKSSSCTHWDVRALCKKGRLKEALHMLSQHDIQADSDTYICVLRECINVKGLAEGKQVHAHIVQSRLKPNYSLLNTLVNMYAKCGSLGDARQVFDKMPERDVFTWTAMIAGYANHGCGMEAFRIYQQMQREGVKPNNVTFICILKACASLGAVEKGRQVHADLIKAGIAMDIILETALTDMYAKCGSLRDARQVFDDMAHRNVVSWNAIITGYAQHGCGREALEVYEQMKGEGVISDKVTFMCVLHACSSLGNLEKGKVVHADIMKSGLPSHIKLENALVNMYAKCGSMNDARQVFDNMAQKNVVSWSTMIAGCARHGCGREALEAYEQMIEGGVTPDKVTFISLLNACASLAALEKGKEVHADIITAGIEQDIILETALVDMYAKSGNMNNACQVFDNMVHRDVVSWSSMIAGYAQHGCGGEALQLFERMQQEGLKPDGFTFMSLLSACSNVGLVDEGCHYFDSMSRDHGFTPKVEHFGCIVDLLGRAGRLDEAEDIIYKMPLEPGAAVWRALLGACRMHGNLEVAERAAKCLLKWDP